MSEQEPQNVHDVVQDHEHQRREWRAERAGWAAMALLLLAAFAGILGPGPLSRATAATPSGALRIDYERVERHGARARFSVHVAATTDDTMRIWVGREFIDRVRLERVHPEPAGVAVAPDRLIFSFARAQRRAPVDLIYHFEPASMGTVRVRLGLDGRPREDVEFHQFYLP